MEYATTPFVIYTQDGRKCLYCVRAASLLDEEGLPYSLRPLARSKLLEVAAEARMATVPIIYHGIRLVGGFDDLKAYVAN